MNILKRMIGCAMAAALAAPVAAAAAAPSELATQDEAAVRRAGQALSDLDVAKLYADKAYAAEILAHAELLSAHGPRDASRRRAVGDARLVALDALDRQKDALALGRTLMAAADPSPLSFALTASAAGSVGEPAAVLEALEAATAKGGARGAEAIREMLSEDLVTWTFQRFNEAEDKTSRRRLGEALLALGWPDPTEMERRDWYRTYAIDGRLEAGDIAGARRFAAEVGGPTVTVHLLTAKLYAPLFEDGADPAALVEAALERENRYTLDRLAAEPGAPQAVLERAQALRRTAREEEALALLLPASADLAKVAEGGEPAFWGVNEAVFSLLALGRGDEAVKLMEKLLTLDMEKHPELISMAINHGEVLNAAGRHDEAAAWSKALDGRAKGLASDYGFMWIWSNAACAHALGGDQAAAAPWLARLKEKSASNRSAHIRALLCAGDMGAAEAVMIERLSGDEAEDALVPLQDYRLGETRTPMARLMEERWTALRARPAVQAAIAKVGRILPLPLSKIYWGDY